MKFDIKEIPNYPGYYCAKDGTVFSCRRGFLFELKPSDSHGYSKVRLLNEHGMKNYFIHRAVLASWVGPREDMFANHKNGIKKDNRLENLEWVTPLENETHSRGVLGKKTFGHHNGRAKLTVSDVRKIRKLWEKGQSFASIGRQFGIHETQAGRIAQRQAWSHVD